MSDQKKPMEHVTSNAAEHTGQPRSARPPAGKPNPDPYTNSGYPAGGERSQPGRDAFGRKPREDGAPPDPKQGGNRGRG